MLTLFTVQTFEGWPGYVVTFIYYLLYIPVNDPLCITFFMEIAKQSNTVFHTKRCLLKFSIVLNINFVNVSAIFRES